MNEEINVMGLNGKSPSTTTMCSSNECRKAFFFLLPAREVIAEEANNKAACDATLCMRLAGWNL